MDEQQIYVSPAWQHREDTQAPAQLELLLQQTQTALLGQPVYGADRPLVRPGLNSGDPKNTQVLKIWKTEWNERTSSVLMSISAVN